MMDYRTQQEYDRAQRRAYRRQRRGYFGGISGIVWLVIILSVLNSHWFWALFPLVFFAIPFFFWVIRPMFWSSQGMTSQQPFGQPGYQQPEQPYTQQPAQQEVYQPYTQGYAAQQPTSQPHETYQEGGQAYQYQAESQQTQQYEDPLTMYPQE
jgi:hypothetical protein